MADDYYTILEIERNASDDDIKRAYRRQALRWHPDKNPDNKEEAEERFKKIAEAYEVLSDSNKRSIYDRYGKRGLDSNGGDSDESANFAFAGNPFFPFGAAGMHGGRGHTMFSDPFELFRQVFGDDPFMGMNGGLFGEYNGNRHSGRPQRNGHQSGMVQEFGFPGFGMSFFSDNPFGNFGNVQVQSFSSSGGFGGMGGGNFRSVSSSTRVVNGKRVTTTRIVENGSETVKVEENGVTTSIKVDGVEQMVEFRPQQRTQSHSHAHARHQNGHDAHAVASASSSSGGSRRSAHHAHGAAVDTDYYHPHRSAPSNSQQYDSAHYGHPSRTSTNIHGSGRKSNQSSKAKSSKNTSP